MRLAPTKKIITGITSIGITSIGITSIGIIAVLAVMMPGVASAQLVETTEADEAKTEKVEKKSPRALGPRALGLGDTLPDVDRRLTEQRQSFEVYRDPAWDPEIRRHQARGSLCMRDPGSQRPD